MADADRTYPDKLPAPKTWEEFEAGVNKWMAAAHLTHCPRCGDALNFGLVVGLDINPNWPTPQAFSGTGTYPLIPLICEACGEVIFLHALAIFEPIQPPPFAESNPSPS